MGYGTARARTHLQKKNVKDDWFLFLMMQSKATTLYIHEYRLFILFYFLRSFPLLCSIFAFDFLKAFFFALNDK